MVSEVAVFTPGRSSNFPSLADLLLAATVDRGSASARRRSARYFAPPVGSVGPPQANSIPAS